ncbi:MAG: hypothetical protein IJV50_03670 [Lachnospiraceae bacterium]|nr:hypothetical protein [Lachnospiraceae bacterium]
MEKKELIKVPIVKNIKKSIEPVEITELQIGRKRTQSYMKKREKLNQTRQKKRLKVDDKIKIALMIINHAIENMTLDDKIEMWEIMNKILNNEPYTNLKLDKRLLKYLTSLDNEKIKEIKNKLAECIVEENKKNIKKERALASYNKLMQE